jgi:hypothetical protein
MSLTILPTSITSFLLSTIAHMLIHSLTWPPEFSRTHPCWGYTMENHLSYTLQHKCVSYLPMELTLETPFLPLRPLHTSTFHQLKRYYLKNYLRTLLHHLSLISPFLGENPSLGDNPSRHYSNYLLLPPTESSKILGIHNAYPSQHGACHPYIISTLSRNGSSTISPSSTKGNLDADSIIGSFHTTLTPNFQHHYHGWGKMEEERSHKSTSSPSSTSLHTMQKRGTPH